MHEHEHVDRGMLGNDDYIVQFSIFASIHTHMIDRILSIVEERSLERANSTS